MSRVGISGVVIGAAALFSLYAWAEFLSTFSHPGAIGLNLDAPGTDWMVFYGAARLFLAGKAGLIFHGQQFTDVLNTAFSGWLSQPMPFRPWVYPPSYLLLMLPFGTLSFGAAYAAFQAVSAVLLAAALFCGADRPEARAFVIAAALLCPAAALNVAAGQNAFLTAALLIGGFRLAPRRPLLGGAVLGILTFKPQFWILVPIALVAERNWKALGASLGAAAALAAASAAVLGIGVWQGWLHLALTTYWNPAARWVLNGRIAGDSIWACLVVSGVPASIANALQGAAVFLAAAAVYRGFRLPLPPDRKLAALLAATIFAAPHSSIHDAVMLAIAAGLWIVGTASGRAPAWKGMLALLLWLAPLVNPPQTVPLGRLTPLLILAFLGVLLAGRDNRSAVPDHGAAGPLRASPDPV